MLHVEQLGHSLSTFVVAKYVYDLAEFTFQPGFHIINEWSDSMQCLYQPARK